MSCFAVTREAGPSWTDGEGISGQPALGDHAAFMNALSAEGFVLCAGPLAGSEHGRIRVLLIINAGNEAEIRQRLADDPWSSTGQLQITSIEPWSLLAGAERLSCEPTATSAPA